MPSANALEILITSRDNASKSLAIVATNVGEVGKQADLSASKVDNFGSKLARVANTEIPNKLQQISRSIAEVGQKAPSVLAGLGAGFLAVTASVQNNAIAIELFKTAITTLESELIGTKRSLSDIKDSLIDTTKLFTGLKESGTGIGEALSGSINTNLAPALKGIDKLLDAAEIRVNSLKDVAKFSGYIQQAALSPSNIQGGEEVGAFIQEAKQLLGVLGSIGQEVFFLTAGFQQLTAVFRGPFDAFIGQNIKLQETLLSTQSQIAATNKVFKNGFEITNATQSILALGEASKSVIDKIRVDSLKLVGVTSTQLITELLPVVTRNLAQLGGQLGDVPKLVTALGASLGTINLPLNQASQELTSIAQGTIDVNSQLARSLNITNQQVSLWKQQNKLIPELTARLQPFVEGNALAAAQIGGVSSNIQEVFELITQKAGETFLDPIVKRLNEVYKLVDPENAKKAFDELQKTITDIVKDILDGAFKLVDGVGALAKSAAPAIIGFVQLFARTVGDLLEFIGDTIKKLAEGPLRVLFAALGALSQYAEAFTAVFKLGLLLKIREVILGLAVGGLGLLIKTLPVVSTLFGLFSLRSNEAVRSLVNLQGVSNTSIASLLTLGKNINSIPGGVEELAKAFPLLGKNLGVILPQISQFGIALISLGQKFPLVGKILQSLDSVIPKIVADLARLAIAFLETSQAAYKAGASLGVFQTIGKGLNTEPIIAGLKALTTETKISDTVVNTFGKNVGTLRKSIGSGLISFGFNTAVFLILFNLLEKIPELLNKIGEIPFFAKIGEGLKQFGEGIVLVGKFITQIIQTFILPNLGYILAAIVLITTTIYSQLIPAIAATIATQIAGWLVGLFGILGSLIPMTQKLAFALDTVAKAEGIEKLTKAFYLLGPAIASALLPLAAIVAAVATIGIKLRESVQNDEIKAIDANLGQEQTANSNTFALLGRAKKAKEEENKATAQGLKLTKEQYAENAKLQKQVEDQIASEKQRLAGLEEGLKGFKGGEEEKAAQQGIIDRAKDNIKRLEESVQSISIAAKDLPQYGSAIAQFARNVQTGTNALRSAAGDPNIFKQQVEALLEGSKQLQESGLLNAEQAAKTYADIASNASVDAQTQIKAQQAITEAYKIESQKRLDIYDTQTKRIQTLVATGKISEAEGIAQTTKLTLDKLAEEQDAIEKAYRKRLEILEKNTNKAVKDTKKDEAIADLKIQAAKGDPTKLAEFKEGQLADIDKERKALDLKRELAQKDLDELTKSSPADGKRSQKRTEEIAQATEKVKQLQEELDKLDKQKDVLDKTIKVDKKAVKDVADLPQQIEEAKQKLEQIKKEKADAIAAEEKGRFNLESRTYGIRRKAAVTDKTQEEKDQQANISALEARLAAAQKAVTPDAKKEKDALGEKQLAVDARNKAVAEKEKAFAEEKRKRDKARDDAILEAQKELAAQQIKILDTQIKTALDKEKLAETQRLTDLNKLRVSGVKSEAQIKLLETNEKRKQILVELDLQKQKLAQFAALEKKGITVSQADRLAVQLKIAELTNNLTANQAERINDLIAAIRNDLTLAANQYGVVIEKANLKLERQKLLYTALEKSLENQGRLADSSKKLSDSIVAVREADLNVLTKIYDKQQQAIRDAGGAGNFADLELEEKKKLLTEQMAKIKFESLLRQQSFEKESLEREIQKRDLLLERQKIENKMRIESAKVDLAIAQVDVKAAEAEVKQRPNSPEAKLKLDKARLEQQKKEIGFAGLVQESGFLEETGRINQIQAGQERESLANNQFAARTTAKTELVGALTNDALREELLRQIETEVKTRAFGTNGQQRLTGDEVRGLFNTPIPSTQGASLTDPSKYGDVLRRTTANGTLTTDPVKPVSNTFPTSFAELQQKYPDKGLGGIEDLNKKYGGKDAQTFEELNAKYSGKPVTQEATTSAIASSFDNLTKQIDEGFTKTLIAPQMKVDEMVGNLTAEFDKVTKKIQENPVQIKLDDKLLDEGLKRIEQIKISVIDEKQLQRLEAIAAGLSGAGQKVNFDAKSAALDLGTTVNANVTVNQQGGTGFVAGVDVKAGVRDALDTILKRVAVVTSGTK